MEQQEELSQLDKFIDRFYRNIKNKNYRQIKTSITSIESFEKKFLRTYQNRKKEGVYYTVKSISNYIGKKALICLINKKFNAKSQNPIKIQTIDHIYNLNPKFQQKIIRFLLSITICDPACGSGVFLLSAVDLLFNMIKKLNPDENTGKIKRGLLNNLYGYDINKRAIDLTILKLVRWIFDAENVSFHNIVSQLKSNLQPINSLTYPNLKKFDIVIGNPPYGNILDPEEKRLLKYENIFYKDIYCSFILKALNWSSGIIGFLVPKSFLLRQGYLRFRNQLLSRANILKIIDIGSKLFKNATNEVQILLYENKTGSNSLDLKVYDFPNQKVTTYKNQIVDILRICLNYECPLCVKSKKLYAYTFRKSCPYCGKETVDLNRIRIKPRPKIYQLINYIENSGDLNYLNHNEFPKMIRGEEDKGLRLIKEKLMHNTNGSCFFLKARNDFSYYYINFNKSIDFEEINPKDLKGNDFEYYISPKLLIKHNNIYPETIYTKKKVCFTSSIYSLLHEDYKELKYLSALMNSSLIQFYCIYAINNQKDTTINLNQYMIRHLPIVKPDDDLKLKIVKNVELTNDLFEKTNGTINHRIREIIKKVDDLIFDLYSISEPNKKIIITDIKNQIKFYQNIYL